MPRARNIKPGFFANDLLGERTAHARLLFIGLWSLADRAGRLEDRPRKIRAQLFPYETVDVESLLEELASGGFVIRYTIAGANLIQITNFAKHQSPHINEPKSVIPEPEENSEYRACTERAREEYRARTKQKPARNGSTHSDSGYLIADSRILKPDNGPLNPETGIRTPETGTRIAGNG